MSSGNYKECAQGHVYDENEVNCPWCPTQETHVEQQGHMEQQDPGKTVILGGEEIVSTSSEKTHAASPVQPARDLGKTIISRPDDADRDNNLDTANHSVQRRRLRGWLVTYDHADYGLDFKINEGSNSIGSKSDNSITITDGSVSSKHAIILYRQGDFLISDEMSSNGTFVNGEELQPRIPSPLKDGDEVKVGDTTFLFRVAFKA